MYVLANRRGPLTFTGVSYDAIDIVLTNLHIQVSSSATVRSARSAFFPLDGSRNWMDRVLNGLVKEDVLVDILYHQCLSRTSCRFLSPLDDPLNLGVPPSLDRENTFQPVRGGRLSTVDYD
jgi:hypothetical protein